MGEVLPGKIPAAAGKKQIILANGCAHEYGKRQKGNGKVIAMGSTKSDNKNADQADKKKTGIVIIGILLVAIIGLLITVIVLLLRKEPESEREGENSVYVMDEENYEQIAEQMEDAVREGYFETYMNTEWTFPDGQSESEDAILGNSPNNTKPIRCEVLLNDTGEKIFSTSVIPVGSQVPAIKLDVDLDKGVYNAICMVYLLEETEEGTYKDYSSAGFNVVITIQN